MVVLPEVRELRGYHRRYLEQGRGEGCQDADHLPPLSHYESFKVGKVLPHTGADAGINKSARLACAWSCT